MLPCASVVMSRACSNCEPPRYVENARSYPAGGGGGGGGGVCWAGVVAQATAEYGELPAVLNASTRYRYVVLGVRPVLLNVVTFAPVVPTCAHGSVVPSRRRSMR